MLISNSSSNFSKCNLQWKIIPWTKFELEAELLSVIQSVCRSRHLNSPPGNVMRAQWCNLAKFLYWAIFINLLLQIKLQKGLALSGKNKFAGLNYVYLLKLWACLCTMFLGHRLGRKKMQRKYDTTLMSKFTWGLQCRRPFASSRSCSVPN